MPLQFVGRPVGVEMSGGILDHPLRDVRVECLPREIPENLEVDVSAMNIGETAHLSDIKLPEGVELVELAHDNDVSVANVHAAHVAVVEEEIEGEAGEVAPEGEAAAPEGEGE